MEARSGECRMWDVRCVMYDVLSMKYEVRIRSTLDIVLNVKSGIMPELN